MDRIRHIFSRVPDLESYFSDLIKLMKEKYREAFRFLAVGVLSLNSLTSGCQPLSALDKIFNQGATNVSIVTPVPESLLPTLPPTPTLTPTKPPTPIITLPPTPTLTPTPTPTFTPTKAPTPEATATISPLERAKQEWYNLWPKNPEEAARLFGGRPDQWQINPDWNNKQVPNRFDIDYKTIEWRPADPNDLPFYWPKTPEEAVKWFFPTLSPEQQRALLRYIQPAWRNPNTGLVEGWHIGEDHWLDTGIVDLPLHVHPAEVAEGYTVKGTQEPEDDEAWTVFGGFNSNNQNGGPIQIIIIKGQGMTVWMPGTDPIKIALTQAVPSNEKHGWGKLGPYPHGFPPVYPSPQNSN